MDGRTMKESEVRDILAKIMLWGVLLAAAVMLAGGIVYLNRHGLQQPGDHYFSGEPRDLRDPISILVDAWRGSDRALIQFGVILLLMNPLVRVAFAIFGYGAGRDWFYTGVSAAVLGVLLASFFL
jgi:uncharacterized membrane protein